MSTTKRVIEVTPYTEGRPTYVFDFETEEDKKKLRDWEDENRIFNYQATVKTVPVG
mgnify:CR=1 FL=1